MEQVVVIWPTPGVGQGPLTPGPADAQRRLKRASPQNNPDGRPPGREPAPVRAKTVRDAAAVDRNG